MKKLSKLSKGLRFRHQFRIAYSNFLERKWRNILIAVATSIGFTGIFIAFGLGNAIVDLINQGTDGGQLPAQVQIALNSEVTGTSLITKDHIAEVKDLAGGPSKIKYLEVPMSFSVQGFEVEGKRLNVAEKQPAYSQLTSLYEDVTIQSSANSKEEVLAGNPYTDKTEQGISLPVTFLEDFNEQHGTSYDASDLIGRLIKLELIARKPDGQEQVIAFETPITRILKDDFGDSSSYMTMHQLNGLLTGKDVMRLTPYIMLELKDPEETKALVENLKPLKHYRVMSQQDILGMVITFIRVIQGLLIVLSFQAILVSMVMIGIIVNINIMQRSREIGVMKAVGYRNQDIRKIFTMESLVIAVLSFILALIMAQLVGGVANLIVQEKFEAVERVFYLNLPSISVVLGLALSIGYLSAYFPTRKISKLDPVESLRYE